MGELVGIEGSKSIGEAFKAGLQLEMLAITPTASAQYTPERVHDLNPREFLVVSEDVMVSIADTVSPPEVVAAIAIPEAHGQGPRSQIFLLLEAIQDPGNLGSLIRSAEAFGVERVYLSPGCANPWSPKVIRSSAGSVFRQAMRKEPTAASIMELRQEGVRVVGTVAHSDGARVSLGADLTLPIGLVIGNEGSGLSEDVLFLVDERIYIPCLTESLNAAVAGSVLLYDVLSQSVRRLAEHDVPNTAASGSNGSL